MALAARQLERQPLARRVDAPRTQRSPRRVGAPVSRTTATPRSATRAAAPRATASPEAVAPRSRPAAGVGARVRIYVRRHGGPGGAGGHHAGVLRRASVGTRAHNGAAGSTRRARSTAVAFADAAARALPGDPLFDVLHGRARSNAIDPLLRGTGAGGQLTVVPRPRRRGAVRVVAVLCTLLVAVMMGAAAFQTQLARRQVELDRLESDIHSAREQYEVLRRERAELRSPAHLSAAAAERGMVPATEAGFMVLSPEVLAEVQRSAGMIVGADGVEQEDPLQQFRDVKSVTDGAP